MTRMWEVYFNNDRRAFDHEEVKVIATNAKEAIYVASNKVNRNIHQVERVTLIGDTANNRP